MLQLNYSSFLESITIKLINESKLFFSPNLRNQLNNIDDEIAKELLSIESTDVKPDITFVNDEGKEGYLSFITMRNASKLIKAAYPNLEDFSEIGNKANADILWDKKDDSSLGADVYKKSRNILKIGKFVNSVLPNKFTDKQIEEFVNKLKSYQDNNKEKIEVVEGEDINYWYNEENYLKEGGNLGGSCMRYSSYGSRGFFELYVENPEVCRLLILTEGGKLKGRAIIWKVGEVNNWSGVDVEFEYFLDRQYTSVDSDVNKMKNYAEEQGWAYKTYNSHSSMHNVTHKGNQYNVEMTVKVKQKYYNKYPFMDTFRLYDPSYGTLVNKDEDSDSEEYGLYQLDSTSGGYTEIEESGYYSEYYDEDIPEDEAVYSEPLNTYIWSDRAVEVEYGSQRHRGWYPEEHDDIRYSERNSAYYHEDDVIHSEYYDDYILSDDMVEIVDEIWDDGETTSDGSMLESGDDDYISFGDVVNMDWYKKLKDKDYWDNYQGILKSLLTKNYNDKWILKKFEIEVYPTKETEGTDDEYCLLSIDAQILQIELNKQNPIIMDKFEYYAEIDGEDKAMFDKIRSRAKKTLNTDQLELDFDSEGTKRVREALAERIKERMEDLDNDLFN